MTTRRGFIAAAAGFVGGFMASIIVRDRDGTVVSTTQLAEGYTAEVCEPAEWLWSELVTGPTVDVVLPTDRPVRIDVPVAECATLTIPTGAHLFFDPGASADLYYGTRIDVAGVLTARPSSPDVFHEIDSADIDEASYLGGDEGMMTDPGIHVHSSGLLDLHGTSGTHNVAVGTASGGRGHVMWHATAAAPDVSNVLFHRLGPQGVVGRYPVHLHGMADGSRGGRFERCKVVDSRNRAFVPHASHGVTFVDCEADTVRLTPYWWDRTPPGRNPDLSNNSNDITWERCVARNVEAGGRDDPKGERWRVAGFALNRGVGNRCIDCTAEDIVGQRDGDGWAGSDQSSGFHWPEREAGQGQGVWEFRGNKATRCNNGIFVWQNTSEPHVVTDFWATDCRVGVNHGSYRNGYLYDGLLIERCEIGVMLRAVSKGDRQLTFREVTINDCSVGLTTGHHQQAPRQATRLEWFDFDNVAVPFRAVPTDNHDWIEVVGWSECPEWDIEAHDGSLWVLVDTGVECLP